MHLYHQKRGARRQSLESVQKLEDYLHRLFNLEIRNESLCGLMSHQQQSVSVVKKGQIPVFKDLNAIPVDLLSKSALGQEHPSPNEDETMELLGIMETNHSQSGFLAEKLHHTFERGEDQQSYLNW